ncbi:MAG: DUF1009 domain-containing protein [Verrucomicrobiota bacterium]
MIVDSLGIIAGNGRYPVLLAQAARARGVKRIVIAGFSGETAAEVEPLADIYTKLRVGQLGGLCRYFEKHGIAHAIMAGQIAPGNLFDLWPDLKAALLLARLKERNADSIFSAIAEELKKVGVELLPATTFLEDALPEPGLVAGPKLTEQQREDVALGFRIAKECSRLDIGPERRDQEGHRRGRGSLRGHRRRDGTRRPAGQGRGCAGQSEQAEAGFPF